MFLYTVNYRPLIETYKGFQTYKILCFSTICEEFNMQGNTDFKTRRRF